MRHQSRHARRCHRARSRRLIAAAVAAALITGPAAMARADDHPLRLTGNPDCTLKVPGSPLSAAGLATPYVLSSAGIACSERNQDTAAFVQATILDPATGALSVYDPVVRDAGQPPAGAAPPVPSLPPGAVVTLWTGFNGNTLGLTGPGHLQFVSFAQQSYASSPQFFRALRAAEAAGLVTVPPLGTSPADGQACPSSRDFSVVDQDQSDNNVESYPAYGVANGSDERTLNSVDKALGCSTWQVPLASGAGTTSSGPLQEEQAARGQGAPVALVPGLDPFVTRGGQPDLALQDLYRLQVGQPLTADGNDTAAYCQHLASAGEPRLKLDQPYEAAAPMPVVGALGVNLALHLAARFQGTWQNLKCQQLTGMASPVTVTSTDGNGLATTATYK